MLLAVRGAMIFTIAISSASVLSSSFSVVCLHTFLIIVSIFIGVNEYLQKEVRILKRLWVSHLVFQFQQIFVFIIRICF